MKVLLIAPPWREVYGRFSRLTRSLNLNPPLNLGYLAGSLSRAGHQVRICDLEFFPRDFSEIEAVIREFQPGLVGFTGASPIFPAVSRLVSHVKSLGVPTLVGGPHVSLVRARVFLQCPAADHALAGEAEESLVEFVEALERGRAPEGKGTIRRGEELLEFYDTPPLVADLDSLADPAYPGIDFKNYLWSVKGRGRVPTRTILSSRGCPYACVFCGIENLTGRGVRYRDPERVVREMEEAFCSSPARHFVFVDDVLTLNKKRVLAICGKLMEKDLPITWEGDTRADRVDEELLRAMAKAGCTRLNFGIESGDEKVLRGLKKDLDLKRVVESFRLAKKAGMDTRGTAMIGNPGDTRESIGKTIAFLRKLPHLDQPYLSIAHPYPGTELRRMALAGEGGLRMSNDSLEEMRRYGSAVMRVGDIEPEEMVRIQRRALFLIYLSPRRILYNLFRTNLKEGLSLALGLAGALLPPIRKTTVAPLREP